MKFTRQFDRMDCGPACVRMIASYYGRNISLSYLRSISQISREGVSVAGIRNAFSKIGIESATFQLSIEQLESLDPTPVILYWEQCHFVVLEKITRKGRFVICDPGFGRNTVCRDRFKSSWTNGESGVVIVANPTEEFYRIENKSQGNTFINFARTHVSPYRIQLIQSFLALLFGLLLSLLTPFLTQAVIDQGIVTKNLSLLWMILLAQLAVFFGQFILSTIGSWVTLYMSTHISINILGEYLKKLLKLPVNFFETRTIGDFQQRIGDHSRLQSFITASSVETLFSIFSIPVYLIVITIIAPKILVIFLFFTIIAVLWISYFFKKRKIIDYEQFSINSQNQSKVYEMISGVKDIKINNYDTYKLSEWESLQKERYDISKKGLQIHQLQNSGFEAINQLCNIVITYCIAMEVIDGSLTLGMMISIATIIGMINNPLGQLINFLQQYQDAKISLERSQEVHLCDNEDTAKQIEFSYENPQDIKLENVTFSYSGVEEKNVLQGVSFTIPAGKMTAIVGESGSGKTTLMKLLLKFYSPTKGKILIDGKDLSLFSASSIRDRSGIVMQENFIFSDSIRKNIIMGNHYDEVKMDNAINISCIDDIIEKHPLGIDRIVGAEGTGLSGGETQRIMIARAVYKNPLYIMLDEATSSLDADNESIITSNLARSFKDKTRIVIAHRLSTVRNADNIVVLHKGRVVEQGTHDSLVNLKGYYYNLIQNQLELASE